MSNRRKQQGRKLSKKGDLAKANLKQGYGGSDEKEETVTDSYHTQTEILENLQASVKRIEDRQAIIGRTLESIREQLSQHYEVIEKIKGFTLTETQVQPVAGNARAQDAALASEQTPAPVFEQLRDDIFEETRVVETAPPLEKASAAAAGAAAAPRKSRVGELSKGTPPSQSEPVRSITGGQPALPMTGTPNHASQSIQGSKEEKPTYQLSFEVPGFQAAQEEIQIIVLDPDSGEPLEKLSLDDAGKAQCYVARKVSYPVIFKIGKEIIDKVSIMPDEAA